MTPQFVSQITQALANGNAQSNGIVGRLREVFPGVSFTLCSDEDVPPRVPALAQGEGFKLYGLSTSEHCASLTKDLETATGLVIALMDDSAEDEQ